MNSVSILTRLHIALQRLVRWEFWPWQIVYSPIAIFWFILAIKARGWVFFSAANPCMRFGGFVAYSKFEVSDLVPKQYLPKTLVLHPGTPITEVIVKLSEGGFSFPLIIKPDMGERGKGVKVLKTEIELAGSLSKIKGQFLLQEYEDLPMELGVMYSRHPAEEVGKVSSIVIKEFPVLTGDGKSTLQELILGNLRTRLSYKVHFKRFRDRLNEVIPCGGQVQMVTVGNHMLGTTFFGGNHLISKELEFVFDKISKEISGFYIGRYDLKVQSIEELLKGNFKVIEVNGVNSEPCHIYDPNMPLWKGLRDLFWQWNRIYQISVANNKHGVPYASFSEIRSEIKRHNLEGAKHE
jgi:hypothetical protein